MTHLQAPKKLQTVPWKAFKIGTGYWILAIVSPKRPLFYQSVATAQDLITARYIVKLHNESLKKKL